MPERKGTVIDAKSLSGSRTQVTQSRASALANRLAAPAPKP
ncbi:hypothetical protein ACIHQR_30530 [Corallococcus coralloides]